MKFPHYLFLFSFLVLNAWNIRLEAQDVSTPAPGSTVITSDELHVDEASHTALFTGNVLVVGTNFNLKCQEMTVFFTKDNKIDHIMAKGDVVIEQPDRIAHCGQADYFHEEDKFVLTDQPSIIDNKNRIEAPKITIYRTTQQMITEGRTKTQLVQGIGSGTPPPSSAPTPQ
ncbi:MAG TPA: LptA/OstA family protein [Candidatus Methylacidiphilales bacterium]